MRDYYIVNIKNEGMIPWLKRKGPLFGLKVSPGFYRILSKDPRVLIESTTYDDAEKAKKEYLNKISRERNTSDKFKIEDAIVIKTSTKEESLPDNEFQKEEIVEENIVSTNNNEDIHKEESNIDDEIDKILDSVNVESSINVVLEKDDDTTEKEKIKKYRRPTLETMTKAQLKTILRERGYTSGPYAGKYHDTHSMLVDKVIKTQ